MMAQQIYGSSGAVCWAGGRKDGVGMALQYKVSHWVSNRWPVVVHVVGDRGLSQSAGRLFIEVGCPSSQCCPCSLCSPGGP